MIRNYLRYLFILLLAGAYFLWFDGYLSFYVLVLVLAAPVLSLLLALPGAFGTKIDLVMEAASAEKGQSVPLGLRIKNSFPLAGVKCSVVLTVRNTLTGMSQEERFNFIASMGEQTVQHQLTSPGCGQVICQLSKGRAWDYLGLFPLPLLFSRRQCSVMFYPAIHRTDLTVNHISTPDGEGEAYSQTKTGDDPSELLGLREYREGDKLSRVHWKLSQKTGETLVKELGLAVADHLFFLVEPNGSGVENDALLDTFVTLSSFLAERETAHRAAFRDSKTGQLQLTEILSSDSLKQVTEALLVSGCGPSLPSLDNWEFPPGVSHGIYLTCGPSRDVLDSLCFRLPSARLSVLYVTESTEPPEIPLPTRVDLIAIPAKTVDGALSGFQL